MALVKDLVSVEWLQENLENPSIKIIDGTWQLPSRDSQSPDRLIPGSVFFDIDEIAAAHPKLTHMLPGTYHFARANQNMGINENHHVVCYDRNGLFSSPRLWWTYKMFGHQQVSILDGGLPAWIGKNGVIADQYIKPGPTDELYKTGQPLSGIISMGEIIDLIPGHHQIVDARSADRFYGRIPEPRENTRSGHIPGSISLPYSTLKNGELLKPEHELREIIDALEIDLTQSIITTCGSGITAALLAFVFQGLGAKDVRLYDGSWAEWGDSDAPIEC